MRWVVTFVWTLSFTCTSAVIVTSSFRPDLNFGVTWLTISMWVFVIDALLSFFGLSPLRRGK